MYWTTRLLCGQLEGRRDFRRPGAGRLGYTSRLDVSNTCLLENYETPLTLCG